MKNDSNPPKSGMVEAGFGRADITPRVGVELCGYGPYLSRASDRVLDRLWAKALAVRHGARRWVLVSCDLIGFGGSIVETVRRRVGELTGWQSHEIMVHATHTHSGPCPIPELTGWGEPDPFYLAALPEQIARACVEAIANLTPALFHHAEVDAVGFAHNRHLPAPSRTNALALEGKWVTDRPEETDVTAHVLRVDRPDGDTMGFLTYFSCHPVVAGQRNREIHGDFVGMATRIAEEKTPGTIGLFLQGAHGDINSNFVHGQREETLVALEDFSARFSEVILEGLRRAQSMDWEPDMEPISARIVDSPYTETITPKEDLLTTLSDARRLVETALPSSEDPTFRHAMIRMAAIQKLLASAPRSTILQAQSFTLGPLSFTGLPVEIMHRIKRRFQAERGASALLLSVTNGFLGYAPLREHFSNPDSYPAFQVPVMLGRFPFTANFEDEVLAAALKACL